jgi:hypothetical protein
MLRHRLLAADTLTIIGWTGSTGGPIAPLMVYSADQTLSERGLKLSTSTDPQWKIGRPAFDRFQPAQRAA